MNSSIRRNAVILALGVLLGSRSDGQRAAGVSIGELSQSFERLAQTTSRAVVQINVSGFTISADSGANTVAALTRERGVGSGVVLSADGFIITNAHVVEAAQKVTVTLHSREALPAQEDSESAIPTRVIGIDSETDLAVVKVERTGLPFLTFGNSDMVKQGQLVVAFGSPLGLSNSMTMGMVSSPARQLKEDDFMQYIQTDTAINPGNSGGPLVDADEHVIGINTLILSQSGGSEGVGFSIPSNLVRSVFRQLRTRGHVHRGLIAANAQSLTPTLSEGLGLTTTMGVLITDVGPGGPAAQAGLRIGDVVVKMNQAPLRTARQLELAVFRATTDEKLELDIVREGVERSLEVTVAERPDANDSLTARTNPKDNVIPQLGVVGITVDRDVAAILTGLREPSGVAVVASVHEPTAWTSQLQPGDIIHEVNASPVVSVDFLREKLASLKAGSAVVLQIERGGSIRYVPFRAE